MAVDIPNLEDATHDAAAFPNSTDFRIYEGAISGTGVVSGCAVTADSPASLDVDVASGTVRFGLTEVAVTAGKVTITTPHPSNPRRDLVVVSNTGVKSIVAGTPKAIDPGDPSIVPVLPALPADRVALAAIYVPAGATTLTADELNDRRVLLEDTGIGAETSFYRSVTDALSAALTTIGTPPNAMGVLILGASAGTYASWMFAMPNNYAGGNVRVTIHYADGIGTGDVVFRINWSVIEEGDQIDETGTNIDFTDTGVGATAEVFSKAAAQTFTPTGLVAGDLLRLSAGRDGAAGADTYNQNIYLVGVLVEYDV